MSDKLTRVAIVSDDKVSGKMAINRRASTNTFSASPRNGTDDGRGASLIPPVVRNASARAPS